MRAQDSRQPIHSGFSLLELIVAISVLMILAGLLIPLAKNALDGAKVAKVVSLISKLKRASLKYYYDTGLYPMEIQTTGKHELWMSGGTPGWKGPYIDKPLNRSAIPWSGTYSISLKNKIEGAGNGFEIGGKTIPFGVDGSEVILEIPLGYGSKIDLAIDGVVDSKKGACIFFTDPVGGAGVSAEEVHVFLFAE